MSRRRLLLTNLSGKIEFKDSIYSVGGAGISFTDNKYFKNVARFDIDCDCKIVNEYKWIFTLYSIYNSAYSYTSQSVLYSGIYGPYARLSRESYHYGGGSRETFVQKNILDTTDDYVNLSSNQTSFYDTQSMGFDGVGPSSFLYSSSSDSEAIVKLRKLTFYKSNLIIASNFRPAIKDGVCGLYETVSGDFLTNTTGIGSLVCE